MLVFLIAYIVVDVMGIMYVYGLNAFGGSNSLTPFEKVLTTFLSFPGHNLGFTNGSLFLYLGVNGLFWTLIFGAILTTVYLLRRSVRSAGTQ